MSFEVLMMMAVDITISWDVTHAVWQMVTKVSEKPASLFSGMEV
jgi:hypothetical protein